MAADKGSSHQQNLSGLDLAIVLLSAKSNAYAHPAPLMDKANAVLDFAEPVAFARDHPRCSPRKRLPNRFVEDPEKARKMPRNRAR